MKGIICYVLFYNLPLKSMCYHEHLSLALLFHSNSYSAMSILILHSIPLYIYVIIQLLNLLRLGKNITILTSAGINVFEVKTLYLAMIISLG